LLRAFGPLPPVIESRENPVIPAKVELGRRLYHDTRLSPDGDISCATCHPLNRFGADGRKVSVGHRGQQGERNTPTVYNAAGHFAQFWDGRAATVEEQAGGPVLNPVEIGMPSEGDIERVLRADAGYREAFAQAFPGEAKPVSFANMAKAIGAFERTLTTPSRWDAYLQGDANALTPEEIEGFSRFNGAGCMTCHRGVYVGGEMFSRLGIVKPWPHRRDMGRYQVTRHERDRFVFKVPGLRNVAETGPYLHDGSIASLDEMIRIMGEYQLGKSLPDDDVRLIAAWLRTLTGALRAGAPSAAAGE
jgi:cytochrome c peroxidase